MPRHPWEGRGRDPKGLAARRLSERPVSSVLFSRRELVAAGALVAVAPAWASTADETERLSAFFERVFQRDLPRNPAPRSAFGGKGAQRGCPDAQIGRAACRESGWKHG